MFRTTKLLRNETKGSWHIHYNFDQYLYEPKKGSGEGIGIFGRFGVSDGNPNFMQFFGSLGIGGKGVIPGWLLLTPDIQVVRGAQKEKITIGTGPWAYPLLPIEKASGLQRS